jgi:hypothetical protein
MRIFTFFDATPQIDPTNERKLISLFVDNWRAAGFSPIVLNSRTAMKHPYFEEYHAAVSKLPSVNPDAYDLACFIRWLAVAEASRNDDMAIMADYDVFTWGAWKPEEFRNRRLTFYQGGCPALASGKSGGFLDQCKRFASYKVRPDDKHDVTPHVSDQSITMRLLGEEPDKFNVIPKQVADYGDENWQTAPVVHFANRTMHPPGFVPRHEHIRKLRPW